MKKIALIALALIACEGPTEENLAQLMGDAGEILTDAAQALHDASTADAQSDASTPVQPTRQTLVAQCDQTRTIYTGEPEQISSTQTYATFDVGLEDVRSVWTCERVKGVDPMACPLNSRCEGTVPATSECTQTLGTFAQGKLWVACGGYKTAKVVTD